MLNRFSYTQFISLHTASPRQLKIFQANDEKGALPAWQNDRPSTSEAEELADISSSPPGMNFPRPAWVRLNRLQTGVGLFHPTMHK